MTGSFVIDIPRLNVFLPHRNYGSPQSGHIPRMPRNYVFNGGFLRDSGENWIGLWGGKKNKHEVSRGQLGVSAR